MLNFYNFRAKDSYLWLYYAVHLAILEKLRCWSDPHSHKGFLCRFCQHIWHLQKSNKTWFRTSWSHNVVGLVMTACICQEYTTCSGKHVKIFHYVNCAKWIFAPKNSTFTEEDNSRSGSSQSFMHSWGHHITILKRTGNQPGGHQARHMRHIRHQKGATIISDFSELGVVQIPGITRNSRYDHFGLEKHSIFGQGFVINQTCK